MRALFCLLLLALCAVRLQAQDLVPLPSRVVMGQGTFLLGPGTRIVAAGEAVAQAENLRAYLRPATDLPLPIVPKGGKGDINLTLDVKLNALGTEGYHLEASPERLDLRAPRPAGLFHGIQTIRQLLPAAIFREAPVSGVAWALPAVSIEDAPRFSWRGSHLDVGRHFMPKAFLKKHLDLMALHKLNVFHWHLTEDQGWRIEIRKYPKLTTVGAWRRETVIPEFMRLDRPSQRRYDATPHGGFYTQEDVREIVRYAADRFITVVPEIEMPGHSSAALAAYPQFGNFPERPVEVVREWGVFESVFSVEDRTLAFLRDVLDEVMGLFPSTFIHVGGDECPKAEWARSESALARMKAVGLVGPETTLADLQAYKDAKGKPAEHPALHQLQSWFIRQMDTYLASKGRRLIGWDEILEGGLAPGAAVMSWRGEAGGIEAARAGHDVVMAPNRPTYLDHYQTKGPEPYGQGGYNPLSAVYAFDPVPAALSATEAAHVLGAQGQLWTEYLQTPTQVEYMAWPRLSALAEVLWSPKETRDFQAFQGRLKAHAQRLGILDVGFHPLD
jgi:hexosaminidase